MIRWVGGALLALTSSAAISQQGGEPVRLSSKQVEIVRKGVLGRLKDPDSAKFEQPFLAARDPSGATNVCGYVNSKNSYGGYTGRVAFGGMLMQQNTVFMVFGIGTGGPGGDYSTKTVCAQSGVALN